MKTDSTKFIGKIQSIKAKTRDRQIRFKLELFVLALKIGCVSEACARRGIGKTFYYKWWRRFISSGLKIDSLRELSRRPKFSPKRSKYPLEAKVRELNSQGYGARMIRAMLLRSGKSLSTSVICHILNKRRPPQRKQKRAILAHKKRYELPIPGQRVQIDVKYVPKLIRGQRAYCFSAVDECTRIKYSHAYMSLSETSAFDFLERLKEQLVFPINVIQTDNGFEFTNRFHPEPQKWDHAVKIWCQKNEVEHRLIPPGAKELNGKIERSHRIDEQYFYWKAPELSIEGLNQAMAQWLEIYNHQRPHGGIGYLTPYEKLRERMCQLPKEKLDGNLNLMRRRFLLEVPVRLLQKKDPSLYKKYRLAA